jgi:peptidylprolyl isomerase
MEHVDKIKKGASGSGAVSGPDKMVKVQVAADAKD